MLTHNQKQMVYWIEERENIRIKKELGLPKPWSDNKVMQETYFCNIDREDDKVTKWIRKHITYVQGVTDIYFDVSIMAARLFNLPSTLELIDVPCNSYLDKWLNNIPSVIKSIRESGDTVWNGAYIVSTNGKKMDKGDYCVELLRKFAYGPRIDYNGKTLQQAHKELMKVEGLASFLAAQIIADLKNTYCHPLRCALDWGTFSAPGPGSLRGLEWFWEEPVTAKNYNIKIEQAMEILIFELPGHIIQKLCMQNLQNCFCEYSKYMKVSTDSGRSKRKYNGS